MQEKQILEELRFNELNGRPDFERFNDKKIEDYSFFELSLSKIRFFQHFRKINQSIWVSNKLPFIYIIGIIIAILASNFLFSGEIDTTFQNTMICLGVLWFFVFRIISNKINYVTNQFFILYNALMLLPKNDAKITPKEIKIYNESSQLYYEVSKLYNSFKKITLLSIAFAVICFIIYLPLN